MNLGIVVLEYARAIREEKIHWWDNLVIQYIQELCWLAVPRPDQLKQPQIITLQFAKGLLQTGSNLKEEKKVED